MRPTGRRSSRWQLAGAVRCATSCGSARTRQRAWPWSRVRCRRGRTSCTPILYTDEWGGYGRVSGLGLGHGMVRHGRDAEGKREWARDDDGDGVREVHCNTCEGAGAGLRTFLRMFRGVHKFHLAADVATYGTMTNAKRITPEVVQRMCLLPKQTQTNYT